MKRTALIIGANSNIGSFLAEKLLENSCDLILHYHKNRDRIDKLFPLQNVMHFSCDIKNEADFREAFTALEKTPDILIVCSAVRSSDFSALAESDSRVCHEIIETNIMGTYNVLKVIIPLMRKLEASHIVLFASNVSRIGLENGAIYSASKAAIANLCRSVAKEEAKHNILINAVSPGPVEIDSSHFSHEYQNFRKDYYLKQTQQIPLKKTAQMDDIWHSVSFLISPDNRYITGEEIFITGGAL